MTTILFASDLHGDQSQYEKLAQYLIDKPPRTLLLGGDLFGQFYKSNSSAPESFGTDDFVAGYLIPLFDRVKAELKESYPEVLCILGNDDPKSKVTSMMSGEKAGLWKYMHGRITTVDDYTIAGYSFIPPSPFHLKDWERYDVSRYVDPGCVHPNEGYVTVPMSNYERSFQTITEDLENLFADLPFKKTVLFFHAPPYKTDLDRAALDNKFIDYVPIDVHIGSIAIERFIRKVGPLATFHGHVHEAVRLTGKFMNIINNTPSYQGAHDGPELALTVVDLSDPTAGKRIYL